MLQKNTMIHQSYYKTGQNKLTCTLASFVSREYAINLGEVVNSDSADAKIYRSGYTLLPSTSKECEDLFHAVANDAIRALLFFEFPVSITRAQEHIWKSVRC